MTLSTKHTEAAQALMKLYKLLLENDEYRYKGKKLAGIHSVYTEYKWEDKNGDAQRINWNDAVRQLFGISSTDKEVNKATLIKMNRTLVEEGYIETTSARGGARIYKAGTKPADAFEIQKTQKSDIESLLKVKLPEFTTLNK